MGDKAILAGGLKLSQLLKATVVVGVLSAVQPYTPPAYSLTMMIESHGYCYDNLTIQEEE